MLILISYNNYHSNYTYRIDCIEIAWRDNCQCADCRQQLNSGNFFDQKKLLITLLRSTEMSEKIASPSALEKRTYNMYHPILYYTAY